MNTLSKWLFAVVCIMLTSRLAIGGDPYSLSAEYSIDKYEINSISLSPSGDRFAASDGSSRLIVCDTKDGKIRTKLDSKEVWESVVFTEEQALVSASCDAVVMLWNLEKGKESAPFRFDTTWWVIVSRANLPPKQILCAGACIDYINLLDMNEIKAVGTFKAENLGGTMAVSLAKDRKTLHAVSLSKELITWDMDNKKVLNSLSLGRDVDFAAFGWSGEELFLWKEVRKGDEKSHIAVIVNVKDGKEVTPKTPFKSHVTCVRALPDGGFVCGLSDGSVGLFDKTGFSQFGKSTHDEAVTSITVSDDGQTVLTVSSSGAIKVWSRNKVNNK